MCKWKSKHQPDYECPESPLEGDLNGYCILHSEDENKDIGAFREKVYGRIATTGNRIDFIGCYFPSGFKADFFQKGRFEKPVDFIEATFTQEANFTGTKFSQNANFSKAEFSQKANFYEVEFAEASFERATFSQEASFFGATFSQMACFALAEFSEKAYFNVAKFTEKAYFNGAKFTEGRFISTRFKKGAEFDNAEFREWSFFEQVAFGPGSSFKDVRFMGEVRFQRVNLQHCSFLHSNIDKVDFRYCEFAKKDERLLWVFPHQRQNVLMDELEADELLEGSQDSMSHSERSEESRPFAFAQGDKKLREEEYEPVRRLYLELKRNFEDKKDWNTAGDFHYGEMECRRKGRLGEWLDFLLVTTYYGASGYGERPWRALCCTAGIILLCVPFYWLFDFETYHTTRINLSIASDVSQPSHGLGYWLWYSLKAAFWGRFGEQGVEPPHLLGKGILFFESILSPFFIALFILALRRKVKR